jgi:hypothetical protein
MTDPITDRTFVCDHPFCELRVGPFGLTAGDLIALAQRIAGKKPSPPAANPEEPAPIGGDGPGAGGVGELDPDGEGAACPLCAEADPPRDGKLLGIPIDGELAQGVSASVGGLGLMFWRLIERPTNSVHRFVEALGAAKDGTAKPGPFVIGREIVTAVVLKQLPYDGHVLCLGNEDSLVYGRIGKKAQFVERPAKYGVSQASPSSSAPAQPIYVRELQEDLMWLGYFSPSRGAPTPGQFDVFTLGAVLGFKQDLAEIYKIAFTAAPTFVPPGSIRAGEFKLPILYQKAFLSPVRIVKLWKNSRSTALLGAARTTITRASKAKTAKSFKPQLTKLQNLQTALADQLDGWPHRFVLERPTEPYTPFAPQAPAKSLTDLPSLPADVKPVHDTVKSLKGDEVWSRKAFNARDRNKKAFFGELDTLHAALASALKIVAEISTAVASVTPPAEVAEEWATLVAALVTDLEHADKLFAAARFWLLNLPVQMNAWLDHIATMGMVDQATAVYIKALREGGRIGPERRSAYQLLANPEDFADANEGAAFIRKECTSRPDNQDGRPAKTMPEMFALQFLANESGMKFTRRVRPYNTRPEDRKTRLTTMGIDTNAYRRGSFDAVFHAGGDWYRSRGWGIGQETDVDITLAGVRLKRGLPIVPPDSNVVRHPPSYVDKDESFRSALERKVLAKYDARTKGVDCTFGKSQFGFHYSCHGCLRRFFDSGLIGNRSTGAGGAFVPLNKDSFGSHEGAFAFWLDYEGITAFARASGSIEENLDRSEDFPREFGRPVPARPSEAALDVLRHTPAGGLDVQIAATSKSVAKARGLDAATLAAEVREHIEARRDLPCSWLTTRIRYAGTGPQAFESLMDLLHVVGNLNTRSDVLKDHIKQASAARGGP